jgi:4-amino-4-deoxy-L-arabinose transferase-like glycosyltransferase
MKLAKNVVATAVGVTLLAVVAGASAPLIDRDEPRYAEAVREMIATGDWLVPRNFGRLRPDKPPVIYWAQAMSVGVLGENEVALRLPSALSAGLLVLLTAAIATRLGSDSERAGTFALPGVVVAGMYATPDAMVAAASALSLWAFLRAADGVGWESTALGWVALGAGILIKGPVAPIFVGSALAGRLWGDRPARRRLGWWWGLPVVVALAALWFVPVNLATNWELARQQIGHHLIGRAMQPLEHHGLGGVLGALLGPPFYAVALLIIAFPLGLAPLRVWRRRRHLPPALVRTVAAGVGLPVVILSLVATKLPHYILAAAPLVAVGAAAIRMGRRRWSWVGSLILLAVVVAVARTAPWREVGRAVVARGGAVSVGLDEPSLLYYARGLLVVVDDKSLGEGVRGERRPALLTAQDAARLADEPSRLVVRRLQGWAGWNVAKGRRVEVGLYLVSPHRPAA